MSKIKINRVTKAEDALWDMHHQISEMINTLYEMQNKLPKTKYENTLESMEEIMLYLDNAYCVIERDCQELLLEDAYYADDLDTLSHHRDVKERLDKYEKEKGQLA